METLGSISGSISKAVFGEAKPQAGEEPPSGESGAGTATEPFDAGNAPEQESAPKPTTDTLTPPSEKRPSHSARMPSFTLKESATTTTNADTEPASSDARKDGQTPEVSDNNDKAHEAVKSPFEVSARRSSRSHDVDNDGGSPDRGVSPGQLPNGEHVATGVKGEKLRRSTTGGSLLGGGSGGIGDRLKTKFRLGGAGR